MPAYSEYPEHEAVAVEAIATKDERLERRSRRRRSTISIGVSLSSIALLGTYIASTPPGSTNIQAAVAFDDRNDELSTIAASITGTHMRISCDNDLLNESEPMIINGTEYEVQGQVFPFSLGSAQIAAPVAVLREAVCDTILTEGNLLPETDEYTTHYEGPIALARAVTILLHEKEHTLQVFDEAEANCYAYQKLPAALEDMGMDVDIIPIVTRGLLNRMVAPAHPPNYYSDECHAGGEFDLQISDAYLQK